MGDNVSIDRKKVLSLYFEANAFRNGSNSKIFQIHSKEYCNKAQNEIPQPYCIVLVSLACELYLKLLICLEQIQKDNNVTFVSISKKHKLDELYENLSNKTKALILNEIGYTSCDMENKLNEFSDDFIKWRYIYEENNSKLEYNITFLQKLMNVLFEISKKNVEKIEFGANNMSMILDCEE